MLASARKTTSHAAGPEENAGSAQTCSFSFAVSAAGQGSLRVETLPVSPRSALVAEVRSSSHTAHPLLELAAAEVVAAVEVDVEVAAFVDIHMFRKPVEAQTCTPDYPVVAWYLRSLPGSRIVVVAQGRSVAAPSKPEPQAVVERSRLLEKRTAHTSEPGRLVEDPPVGMVRGRSADCLGSAPSRLEADTYTRPVPVAVVVAAGYARLVGASVALPAVPVRASFLPPGCVYCRSMRCSCSCWTNQDPCLFLPCFPVLSNL